MGGGISMVIHNFQQQRKYSEEASDEPFWEEVYRKAFPNMVNKMFCPGDWESQRMGIDRVLMLSNGFIIKIDEKKRARDRKDILLEYLSNDVTNAPGWIEKDLAINYLAYAFMQSRRVYLLDWHMLRRAWGKYGAEWKRKYKIPPANNGTYKTHSVAVPILELMMATQTATVIQLTVPELNVAPKKLALTLTLKNGVFVPSVVPKQFIEGTRFTATLEVVVPVESQAA